MFTLRIEGANASSQLRAAGALHLVDLAGSERVKDSGAVGQRLKEAQAINKSLSALGDVVAALAAKAPHVPFRSSKLTYLLQHSLGGGAKTLLICNLSPAFASAGETLCTLRFAKAIAEVGPAAAKPPAAAAAAAAAAAPVPAADE